MLVLKRVCTSAKGTFGVLMHEYVPLCVTLELAWNNNYVNKSCIPIGVYNCRRFQSPRFGDTFLIEGVNSRTNIVFHEGNTIKDTNGCILVGTTFDHASISITESLKARKTLMKWFGTTKEFTLGIS